MFTSTLCSQFFGGEQQLAAKKKQQRKQQSFVIFPDCAAVTAALRCINSSDVTLRSVTANQPSILTTLSCGGNSFNGQKAQVMHFPQYFLCVSLFLKMCTQGVIAAFHTLPVGFPSRGVAGGPSETGRRPDVLLIALFTFLPSC